MNFLFSELDEIVRDYELWDYYRLRNSYATFNDVLDNASTFIKKFLRAGRKLDKFDNKISQSLFIDNFRCKHTVSIFFIGLYLYSKNKQLKSEIDKFIKVNTLTETEFVYYWFLICFFHDVASNIEKENLDICIEEDLELLKKETQNSLVDLKLVVPHQIIDTWEKYFVYRQRADHGVIAASVFYSNRYNTYYSYRRRNKDSFKFAQLSWSKEKLYKDHLIIAWTILSHNIWFADGKSESLEQRERVTLYKKLGIENLVIENSIITLNKYPLLFMLAFIDTIDPIKRCINPNCFKFNSCGNAIKIAYEDKYCKKILEEKYWLGINGDYNDGILQINFT